MSRQPGVPLDPRSRKRPIVPDNRTHGSYFAVWIPSGALPGVQILASVWTLEPSTPDPHDEEEVELEEDSKLQC